MSEVERVVDSPAHNPMDIALGALAGLAAAIPAALKWWGDRVQKKEEAEMAAKTQANTARQKQDEQEAAQKAMENNWVFNFAKDQNDKLWKQNEMLWAEMKELRHQMGELQITVGTNQQRVQEVSQAVRPVMNLIQNAKEGEP